MNVLVVGQGGREHALAWKLSKSKKVSKIFVAPGNGGTANEAKCFNKSINVNNFSALEELVNSENIELIVVGPEDPLVNGINNYFQDSRVKVFGPTKEGAQLEGSKIISKKFMFENNIPTGAANFFSESKLAKNYLKTVEFPIVLKADGLAAGKGVLVAKELGEAMQWIEDVMEKNKFGDAGNEVLIEECLFGTELSYMGIMTPKGFYPFETSVDYKPLLDGNSGPNTGGMGCMSPSPFMNSELLKNINKQVVEPTAHGLRKAKLDFYGFMYFGLMVKDNQPKKVMLVTECSMSDNVEADNPNVSFIKPCNLCPYMKKIDLEKILDCVENDTNEIVLDSKTIEAARKSVIRMPKQKQIVKQLESSVPKGLGYVEQNICFLMKKEFYL